MPGLRYTEQTLTLEPGSVLIGYTDGLIERRGHAIDDSLLTLQNGITALPETTTTDVETLADAILNLAPSQPADDDIAIITISFEPRPSRQEDTLTLTSRTRSTHLSQEPGHLGPNTFAVPPSRWTQPGSL